MFKSADEVQDINRISVGGVVQEQVMFSLRMFLQSAHK